jgi:hypothetical protein
VTDRGIAAGTQWGVPPPDSAMSPRYRIGLLALLTLGPLAGCGPSRGQVLFYELELAAASFGVVCLLMWFGRVLYDSRVWFVCSYCLEPNARHDVRDGTMAACQHCGATTSVNELPADLVPKIAPEHTRRRFRLMGRTRRRRILMALLFAMAFQAVLMLAGLAVTYLLPLMNWPSFDKHRPWHEVAFPFMFALSFPGDTPAWWWFNWILVVSYHLGLFLGRFLDQVLHGPPLGLAPPRDLITVTLGQLGLWWFFILLGYRLRRRWWVVPSVVAGANVLVAVAAYVMEWGV